MGAVSPMPTIPLGAAMAASDAIYRRIPVTRTTAEDVADEVLAAALPHLLPGLFCTRHHGDVQIWRENPDHPDAPEPVDGVQLAEILAGLLPDRTEED